MTASQAPIRISGLDARLNSASASIIAIKGSQDIGA